MSQAGTKLKAASKTAGPIVIAFMALLAPAAWAACTGDHCIDANQVGIPQIEIGTGLRAVINILSTIAGIVSVAFMIVGGIRYASSDGNPQNVDRAKQTLLYAIFGLVLSILAVSIVDFVIANGPQ